MANRVAIVAVAQIGHDDTSGKNLMEISYEVTKDVLNQLNMKREELGTIISSSSDFWQGISCSNSVYYEAIGAYLKNSSKAAEDGASGFMYGLMRVMSGHFDNALVHAITKSSEIPSLNLLTNLYADPFFQRPIGLDDVSTAAMQAGLYMEKYGITEDQAAKVVVKNLGNAINNPHAHKKAKLSIDEVLKSEIVAYPLKALVWVMTPAIWLSGLVTRLISRGKGEEAITAEEIQVMARSSRRTGGILFYQEQTIERILTLQEKMTKDVMTPRTVVFSLSEHLTLHEAIAAASGWEHSRIPVYDHGIEDVVGVVHTREILIALSEGNEDKRLSELMQPVHFVAETAKLNEVLSEFLELRQHLFAVIDEYGGLSGIITLEDILEEILGREIVDESDEVADKRELARRKRVPKV